MKENKFRLNNCNNYNNNKPARWIDLKIFTGSYVMDRAKVWIVRRPIFKHNFARRKSVPIHPRPQVDVLIFSFARNFAGFHYCVRIRSREHIPSTFSDILRLPAEGKCNCSPGMRNQRQAAKWRRNAARVLQQVHGEWFFQSINACILINNRSKDIERLVGASRAATKNFEILTDGGVHSRSWRYFYFYWWYEFGLTWPTYIQRYREEGVEPVWVEEAKISSGFGLGLIFLFGQWFYDLGHFVVWTT